jgi:hypothetical protein
MNLAAMRTRIRGVETMATAFAIAFAIIIAGSTLFFLMKMFKITGVSITTSRVANVFRAGSDSCAFERL